MDRKENTAYVGGEEFDGVRDESLLEGRWYVAMLSSFTAYQ
jgi:hypothetical protein